jgi:hypothetical protein
VPVARRKEDGAQLKVRSAYVPRKPRRLLNGLRSRKRRASQRRRCLSRVDRRRVGVVTRLPLRWPELAERTRVYSTIPAMLFVDATAIPCARSRQMKRPPCGRQHETAIGVNFELNAEELLSLRKPNRIGGYVTRGGGVYVCHFISPDISSSGQ